MPKDNDRWDIEIGNFLREKRETSMRDVLEHIGITCPGRAEATRVGNIMTNVYGWSKHEVRKPGTRRRDTRYMCPSDWPPADFPPANNGVIAPVLPEYRVTSMRLRDGLYWRAKAMSVRRHTNFGRMLSDLLEAELDADEKQLTDDELRLSRGPDRVTRSVRLPYHSALVAVSVPFGKDPEAWAAAHPEDIVSMTEQQSAEKLEAARKVGR